MRIKQNTQYDNNYIHKCLEDYNIHHMSNYKDYSSHIEEKGEIIAGMVAESIYDTLELKFLWVKDTCRNKGYGRLLLHNMENQAAKDGIKRILLNTYSFQAPLFYEKMGYHKLFTLRPCFKDYEQYYFIKEI